jgi:hypothetical protein
MSGAESDESEINILLNAIRKKTHDKKLNGKGGYLQITAYISMFCLKYST